jgi:predicted secreted protein
MKKILLAALVVMLLAVPALADPWLVCDPYPTGAKPDGFKYVLDTGTEVSVAYSERLFGTENCAVVCDLAGVTTGNHNISVKAWNIWGDSASVPFAFSKSLPGGPSQYRFRK